jgi:AcrR family transcriptional regulator
VTGRRRAESVRNDERVLRAARDVLTAAPAASMAEIAARAGVGVGTLYRRYPSKDALVAAIWLDSIRGLEAEAGVALDRARMYPWGAFVGFMTASVASGAGALVATLAGTLTPTEELVAAEQRLRAAVGELLECTQAAGAVRPDITAADVGVLFEQLRAVRADDARREATLRRRYLEPFLQALRAPGAAPLPGPPPAAGELGRR